jgi:hypothetical protein
MHSPMGPAYIWTAGRLYIKKESRNNTHRQRNVMWMLNTLIFQGFGLADLDFLNERHIVKKVPNDPTIPFFSLTHNQ